MYIETFEIRNHLDRIIFDVNFYNPKQKIRRWSVFENRQQIPAGIERKLCFKLLAVCLGASPYIQNIKDEIFRGENEGIDIGRFGITLRSDVSYSGEKQLFKKASIRYLVSEDEGITLCPEKSYHWRGDYLLFSGFNDFKKTLGNFAYGFDASIKGSIYQKLDPDFSILLRSSRFGTFFNNNFPLTSPEEWLNKQYHAAIRNSIKASILYNTTITVIKAFIPEFQFVPGEKKLILEKKSAFSKDISLRNQPSSVSDSDLSRKIKIVDFLTDFIRQLADSCRITQEFNLRQGILFIDHFENLFPPGQKLKAKSVFERLFPNIQIIVGCDAEDGIKKDIKNDYKTLPVAHPVNKINIYITAKLTTDRKTRKYRNQFLSTRFCSKNSPADKSDVVLVDIDSSMPNLSLMKLSRYYKNQGRNVILCRDSSRHQKSKFVFASCIFNRPVNEKKIQRLKYLHGENIQFGGSGISLSLSLPDEIESLMPDYTLYPGIDFGTGFLTRGCPYKCAFCIVPVKEGPLRQVCEIDDILPPKFDKLVLMDNNLLAHPNADKILAEICRRGIKVNFNQTLDIKLINRHKAMLLQKVDSCNYSFTRRMYYFSFNEARMIPVIKKKLALLKNVKQSEIRFVCMYGYNTTLSDDIERFLFLSQMSIAPFVQRYQPILGAKVIDVNDYFDTDIERLLEVHFPQNGQIFENFLEWVSRKYAEKYGKLYMPLVDLIFKYNKRHLKAFYIESLAGIKKI